MKVFQHERQLRTTGGLAVRDITEEVVDAVRESGVVDGIACVYSPHTTCCVRVNEFENGFLEDFANMLKRLVPSETYYAHDDWDRRTENICPEDMDFGNGHSHCMAMLLGTAGESIPVRDGELCLGTWQRVLVPRARPRARPPLDRAGSRHLARQRFDQLLLDPREVGVDRQRGRTRVVGP